MDQQKTIRIKITEGNEDSDYDSWEIIMKWSKPMAYNPKGLLRTYIIMFTIMKSKKLDHYTNSPKLVLITIQLNQYLITESGKDFWDWQMYTFIDSMEEYYNTNSTPKEHISFKLINVPETVELHDLDATQ